MTTSKLHNLKPEPENNQLFINDDTFAGGRFIILTTKPHILKKQHISLQGIVVWSENSKCPLGFMSNTFDSRDFKPVNKSQSIILQNMNTNSTFKEL